MRWNQQMLTLHLISRQPQHCLQLQLIRKHYLRTYFKRYWATTGFFFNELNKYFASVEGQALCWGTVINRIGTAYVLIKPILKLSYILGTYGMLIGFFCVFFFFYERWGWRRGQRGFRWSGGGGGELLQQAIHWRGGGTKFGELKMVEPGPWDWGRGGDFYS